MNLKLRREIWTGEGELNPRKRWVSLWVGVWSQPRKDLTYNLINTNRCGFSIFIWLQNKQCPSYPFQLCSLDAVVVLVTTQMN